MIPRVNIAEPLLHQNEPVVKRDNADGFVASAAHAAGQNAAIGTCFINTDNKVFIVGGRLTVIVEGMEIPETNSLNPLLK